MTEVCLVLYEREEPLEPSHEDVQRQAVRKVLKVLSYLRSMGSAAWTFAIRHLDAPRHRGPAINV